jgi:diaminopimelate epimerase
MIINRIYGFNFNLTQMIIPFNKYHGTGNDFIIIDNRNSVFNPAATATVKNLCTRRFGIGSDGLILISAHADYDYEMKYYNSDGNESSMCGNGGRCAAAFSYKYGIAGLEQRFLTFDGVHEAVIKGDVIRLKMNNINEIKTPGTDYFLDTGSPHFVRFVRNVKNFKVFDEGKKIRNSREFSPGGTNVNFVEVTDDHIFVRTYERGVEDETLSCGTGITASAIASVLEGHFDTNSVNVKTLGGSLSVEFRIENHRIVDVWLCGPAAFVYEGEVEV